MKIAFVSGGYENLGIEFLSGILKKFGHETKLFVEPQLFDDESFTFPFLNKLFSFKDRIAKDVVNYCPDLIGFSVVSDFYGWACEIAKSIKMKSDIPIIFGGIHPTCLPERTLANTFVDMICIGEGEIPLLELMNCLENGKTDYDIKNIWFKKNGKIIKNELRPLIEDLDSLPLPDKEIYYEASSDSKKEYFTIASRGCPFSCSYCYNSALLELYKDKGKYLRRRSVDNLISELSFYTKKYKFNYIRFFDDTFVYDRDWLKEFSEKYRYFIGLPFLCYVRPDAMDEYIARELKDAGCCEVEFGIQTWDEKTRERVLNRFISNEKIERAINVLKDVDIAITCDNIFGIPGQSESDLVELTKFYNKYRIARIHVLWLRYYPKTKIISIANGMGILKGEEIEEIERAEKSRPYTQGGSTFDSNKSKFQTLLALLPLLNNNFVGFLMEKRAYRFFPPIHPSILRIFNNFFGSKSKFDYIMRKRTFYRYFTFLFKKIFYI